VKGGFFLRKKSLECVLLAYTNPENAIEPGTHTHRNIRFVDRINLDSRPLVSSTMNFRLGAVRCQAFEATDGGLLSSDLEAGIRRVRGVKKLGVRFGNWLPPEQGQALCPSQNSNHVRG
jgi:hypothetical protein